MINRAVIALIIVFLQAMPGSLMSQDINQLLQQGEALEKQFRDDDALKIYNEILVVQPDNVAGLSKSSELYSLLGKRQPSKDKQKKYYHTARALAARALKIKPDYAEANFAMAVAMGRIALVSSGEDKIKAVQDIKTYAEQCIRSDPSNYKGYHVLGKWHYEVSDLSAIEKWLVKVTYGGLPPASLDASIKNYEKSKQLNPGFLLNYLELAKAYKRKDQKNMVRSLLTQLEKLPPVSYDDAKIKGMGKKMLEDLKN